MTDYEDMKADAARNGQVWLDNFASTHYKDGYDDAKADGDAALKVQTEANTAMADDLKACKLQYMTLNGLYNDLLDKQRKIIHDWNFDGVLDGTLTAAGLKQITGTTLAPALADAAVFKNCKIMTDTDGTRFIRVNLLKGLYGGSAGIVVGLLLKQMTDHAKITTRLRFDPNFDPMLGGKLPGLSGNTDDVPWSLPAGGNADPDHKAVSCRMMWKKLGWLISYPYTSRREIGQTVVYGEDILWNAVPTFGKWVTTSQDLLLNTVDVRTPRADGAIVGSLDNMIYLNKNGYIFRDRPELKWKYVMMSCFSGGNDATWAPSRDTYVDFARITVEDLA